MKILNEVFNIKNATKTAKDGHKYNIAYIDPSTSENTFNFKDEIKKYGAKFFSDMKAWGWHLGSNPQEVYNTRIKPCLEYLASVEDGGNGTRKDNIIAIIDELLEELKKYPTEDVYIIGGDSVYKQMLPYVDVCHVTKIDHAYQADAYFEDLSKNDEWKMTIETEEMTYFDIEYTFQKWERVSNKK